MPSQVRVNCVLLAAVVQKMRGHPLLIVLVERMVRAAGVVVAVTVEVAYCRRVEVAAARVEDAPMPIVTVSPADLFTA